MNLNLEQSKSGLDLAQAARPPGSRGEGCPPGPAGGAQVLRCEPASRDIRLANSAAGGSEPFTFWDDYILPFTLMT